MKNIIFVIESLHCAGAEKSLTTLLSLLDYSKYNVDLMMFCHGGALEELVPKEVNILKPPKYIQFTEMSLKSSILDAIKYKRFNMLKSRIKFSFKLRSKKYNNVEKARLYWKYSMSVIEESKKHYDIAISYAQGIPTFYVAEKIRANKKFAWVNTSYRLEHKEKIFHIKFYDKYDNIIAVSDSAKSAFLETFPQYKNKVNVIYDINNYDFIKKMSNLGESYNDNFDGIRILTIGRLAYGKRYDRAIESCRILKEKGINLKWYALGIGSLKEEITELIKANGLENEFILLGIKSNPYPYIKDCDIYVQTSDFEGFGLAIAEARMLNIPVVTTEFDAVYNQMVQGKNGLVVDMDSESIANGILKLINDKELRHSIVEYLKTEKKGNTEELEKFYNLIET